MGGKALHAYGKKEFIFSKRYEMTKTESFDFQIGHSC